MLTSMSTRPHLLRVSLDHRADSDLVCHGGRDRERLASPSLDFCGNFVGDVFVQVVDDDPRSFSREKICVLAAEPAARAGNDRNPPRQ